MGPSKRDQNYCMISVRSPMVTPFDPLPLYPEGVCIKKVEGQVDINKVLIFKNFSVTPRIIWDLSVGSRDGSD